MYALDIISNYLNCWKLKNYGNWPQEKIGIECKSESWKWSMLWYYIHQQHECSLHQPLIHTQLAFKEKRPRAGECQPGSYSYTINSCSLSIQLTFTCMARCTYIHQFLQSGIGTTAIQHPLCCVSVNGIMYVSLYYIAFFKYKARSCFLYE